MYHSTGGTNISIGLPTHGAVLNHGVVHPPIQGNLSFNTHTVKPGYTLEDLQLTGACDWYKLQRLVHAENHLIKMLRENGLSDPADKLEHMRDNVLAHRMANSPFASAKSFLRDNCGNDAYIEKWRKDIHNFDTLVGQELKRNQTPVPIAIEIRYLTRLLDQQAKASLPYTGYYNPVAKAPEVKEGLFKKHVYEKRFALGEFKPSRPLPDPVKAGFL